VHISNNVSKLGITNIHDSSSFDTTQQLSSAKAPLKPEQTLKIAGLIAEEVDDSAVPSEREERQRVRDLVHALASFRQFVYPRKGCLLSYFLRALPPFFLSTLFLRLFVTSPLIRVCPHIRLLQPSRFGQARFLFRRMIAMPRTHQMHRKAHHASPCASSGRSRTLRMTTAGSLWSMLSVL